MKRGLVTMVPLVLLLAGLCSAYAGTANDVTPMNANGRPAWAKGSTAEAARLRAITARQFEAGGNAAEDNQAQAAPLTLTSRNKQGVAATFLPQGNASSTATEAFFTSIGSNGRSCDTCHEPDAGWTITPTKIKKLFRSDPSAPLFRPVDGTVCPKADTSTPKAAAAAYRLLLNKGLIRVFIPMPSPDILQFAITGVADPYDCNSDPGTGLTSPTTGIVSQYRRPQPSSNLSFLSTIMWDGREPDLMSQANDAVLIHAQGPQPAGSDQLNQITQFESGLFSAQKVDNVAGDLTADGNQGGAESLSRIKFVPNINAPGPGFNPAVMTMFLNWNNSDNAGKASIARGQNLFNEKSFTITGVAGLNDVTNKSSIRGTCSSCHNMPNIGVHSSNEILDLGIATAPASNPATNLSLDDLPVFTIHCNAGPLAGTDRQVTDLGRALITGQCADIGKVKTAMLRDLAARPPYFHNGSAPDLQTVVDFYNNRFNVGLTDQENTDLVAFLASL